MCNAKGIDRKIDDLGRVVIPKEYRNNLGINEGDSIEILMDSENQIILRKKRNPVVQTTIEELKEICNALKYNPELDMDIDDYRTDWVRTIEDAILYLRL